MTLPYQNSGRPRILSGLGSTITWHVVLWDDGKHVTPRGEVLASSFLAEKALLRHPGARRREIQTRGP